MMATRLSSRIRSSSRIERPAACVVRLVGDLVDQLGVSSGTSISLVQGHFRHGPNWAMKWRMPASPPAMR